MKTSVKTGTRVQAESQSTIQVRDKVAFGSLLAMGGISGVIGIWSLLCFASALLSEGPIAMLTGFFKALTGI